MNRVIILILSSLLILGSCGVKHNNSDSNESKKSESKTENKIKKVNQKKRTKKMDILIQSKITKRMNKLIQTKIAITKQMTIHKIKL